MRNKVLKLEFYVLLFITLTCCVHFYFEGSLPDNFLEISSEATSSNLIVYSVSSYLAFFGFYLGPWVIFPFLVMACLYFLIFKKREYSADVLTVIPLVTMLASLSYLFFPVMLGEGLNHIMGQYLDSLTAYGLLFLTALLFLVGVFRSSFKSELHSFITKTSSVFYTSISSISNTAKNLGSIEKYKDKIKLKISESRNSSIPVERVVKEEEPKNIMTSINIVEKKKDENIKPNSSFEVSHSVETTHVNSRELIRSIAVDKSSRKNINPDESYFKTIIQNIEDKLAEFNIDAKIIDILKGPVVDTFELELGEGIRVSKVTSLTQDLSLALAGAPIRIIHPMEGRTTMGIEVPRNPREVIFLEDVLGTPDFSDDKTNIALAMGKDAFGKPFITDLTKMPHMLVAGATGAGKSVFINTLLVSILVKMPPEKLKLILIDPKQLELALYRNLPHLIMPVITDPNRASLSLLWAVEEMERRYTILSKLGVRSIDGFNAKIKKAPKETLASINHLYEGVEDQGYELPYLVLIIDEFADLILTKNGKAIENNICRLAAKARACGIHLVIATQRPSVDVITGLIKANFPTRVSFRVTAGQDSRTILNSIGAENLLGKGDMLYKHGVEMKRLHSAYIDEEEIAVLVDKISTEEPKFLEKAMDFIENGGEGLAESGGLSGTGASLDTGSDNDPLYAQAVKVVVEHRSASASMLQRRLKVGYNRAANLIETMEDRGVVGPQQGSKPRQVLVNSI